MQLDYESLGIRIKNARKRIGLTQERLAEYANISSTHLSNIENGRTHFSLEVLIDLINALSVRPDELLCDSVEHSGDIYITEVQTLLSNCTNDEFRFVIDIMKNALNSYRKSHK